MSTTPPLPPKLFHDVLHEELDEIARSRKGPQQPSSAPGAAHRSGGSRESLTDIQLAHVKPQDDKKDHFWRARESELLGLTFSGGGIRSATFNLGVLQGLAKYRLLPRFDYLSTVSGGGYIGSWFTAWIKRKGLAEVQRELAREVPVPRSPEPREINFLRQYSNYLTPKTGAFSADTWTMVSIYLRNLLLNLTILVFALGAGIVLVKLLSHAAGNLPRTDTAFWWLAGAGMLALLFAAQCVHRNISRLSEYCPRDSYGAETYQGAIQRRVVIPILFAAWAFSSALISAALEWRVYLLYLSILMGGLVYLIGREKQPGDPPKGSFLERFAAALVGGAVTGGGLYLFFPHLRDGFAYWAPVTQVEALSAAEVQFIWGVPVVLSLLLIGGTFYIGLMGNDFSPKHREWWARVGAWLHIYSIGWAAVSLVTLVSPWMVSQMSDWVKMALTSGWLGTTIGGLLAGKSTATDKPGSNQGLELLARLAPGIFVVGLLVSLSAAVNSSLAWIVTKTMWEGPSERTVVYAAALLGFLAVAFLFSIKVDINEFSMHHFYRDRLVRCYLGASNDDRNPHPFTGFDPIEHYLRISDLQCSQPADPPQALRPEACLPSSGYLGPYYLVNTAMNLVSGKNLAWQQRMATSFVFTPKHAGFAFLLPDAKQLKPVEAFRPAEQYEGGVSLGTAVAISGAAASPNMGYHSSKALAFLMTVFNVRLGWWFGNPMKESWGKPGPPFGLAHLFAELFGFTNEESSFVYLSDGGHFENLGIYELVRRRCRFIIACDGGQDGDLKFADLGNAIEKCRTDLGIDVDINVDPIRCPANSKMSKRHCAVGTIHYEHVDPDAPQGILVYIKSSITGDEPTDVLRYSALNKVFPHQSTGDQFFDESQFESYRALGQHIAEEVLDGAGEVKAVGRMSTYNLFLALKRYWYPSSVQVEAHFTKHAAKVDAIYKDLRTSKNLAFLSHQIYPEWRKLVEGKKECEPTNLWLPQKCDQVREGFYICNQVIQLMESVYVDLDLDQEYDHPDNRGWMNFFRHWSWAGMFRVTWAISAATFGARFQTFCERHLDLTLGEIDAKEEVCSLEDNLAMLKKQEKRMLLNFFEVRLLEDLIRHDGESESWVHPLVLKVSIPSRPEFIEFPFGVGLTYKIAGEGAAEARKLRFFRVQDHLRQMGLGREGLTKLMLKEQICHLDLSLYPGDGEDGKGPFASVTERMVLDTLFESVKAQLVEEQKLRC